MARNPLDDIERGRDAALQAAKNRNRAISLEELTIVEKAQIRLGALEHAAKNGSLNGPSRVNISDERLRKKFLEASNSAENFAREVSYSAKKNRVSAETLKRLAEKLLGRIDKLFTDPEWERIEKEQAKSKKKEN